MKSLLIVVAFTLAGLAGASENSEEVQHLTDSLIEKAQSLKTWYGPARSNWESDCDYLQRLIADEENFLEDAKELRLRLEKVVQDNALTPSKLSVRRVINQLKQIRSRSGNVDEKKSSLKLARSLILRAQNPDRAFASRAWEIRFLQDFEIECDYLQRVLAGQPEFHIQAKALKDLLNVRNSDDYLDTDDQNISRLINQLKVIEKKLGN